MTTDIKRLLNKKGWTGKELGIIELTNLAVTFQQTIQGQEQKPLIEGAVFSKMLSEIKDPVEGGIYNNYIAVHEWLSVEYNIAQTQLQQAQLNYRTIADNISKAIIAEDVFQYVSKLPLMVTQKQLDRLRAEGIEARFTDSETGEEVVFNVYELIEKALFYYLCKLWNDPKKANPLKAFKKKYSAQKVKSDIIRSQWNKLTDNGYYTLEDGRRSDQMTAEEWQEALTTPKMREILDAVKKSEKDGDKKILSTIAQRRIVAKAKYIFDGISEEEADRKQTEREYREGLATPATWHTYPEPPKDLTKWQVLEEDILLSLYPASIGGQDPYSKEAYTASMQDFYSEFKELIDFLLKDIDSRYKLQLSKLKLGEWQSKTVSLRELYRIDYYGEKASIEDDTMVFDGNRRALFNGIAIVTPTRFSNNIDANGDYIAPELRCSIESGSLEGFFTEAENYAENIEILESSKETLLDSYYFILCFNYAMERIAELYEVPALEVFQIPIFQLSIRIDALNDLIPILYKQIKNTDYSDKELQAKKLKVLQDYFQPIDYKALAISEETKQEIDKQLEGFKAFKPNSTTFHQLIANRPKTATEAEGGRV